MLCGVVVVSPVCVICFVCVNVCVVCEWLCDVVRLLFCVSFVTVGVCCCELCLWEVCVALCDAVWFVCVFCVSVCACVHKCVCVLVCEMLCGAVWYVVLCVCFLFVWFVCELLCNVVLCVCVFICFVFDTNVCCL